MPTFQPYRGLAYTARREARSHGVRLRPDALPGILSAHLDYITSLQQSVSGSAHIGQSALCTLIERIHYLHSHQVYMIKTHFAERLMNSALEVRLDELRIPQNVFEVCFEDDFEPMPGVVAPSFLCCAGFTEAHIGIIKAEIMRMTGQKEVPIEPGLGSAFTVRVPSPWEPSAMLHAAFSFDKEKGKTIEEVFRGLPRFARETEGLMLPLGEREHDLEKKLSTIALGVVCYLNTQGPDAIASKASNRPHISPIFPSVTLFGQMTPPDAAWHIRKAHWRFLRSERFKRDDGGKVRCVWVRSSEVNRDGRTLEVSPREDVLPEETNV
jgi:hypothetical protein